MSKTAVLRGIAGPPGSRLARLLGDGLEPVAPLRGVTGCLGRVVADVSAPDSDLEAIGRDLPDGAALPEALAARLRASGAELRWDAPITIESKRALLELCEARGRSSVEVVRADNSLLTALQLGAWFDAPWRTRMLRRMTGVSRRVITGLALSSARLLSAAADLSFWKGVQDEATPEEWRRLTESSYAVLVYHRFSGESKPGQERIDVAPRRFARQQRALRLTGFRPMPLGDLIAFHADPDRHLPRRRFVITVDDGTADCVTPLALHAPLAPQLYVPTAELGGAAHWIDGEPIASLAEVRNLAAAGVAIGSHTRHHRRLTELDAEARHEELVGSLTDLRQMVPAPAEALAYPNGDHDPAVCAEAGAAGYRVGFTTEKGRNGAGTDPLCLRRVSVHASDGVLAVLWKVLTGEALPSAWQRLRSPGRGAQPT
jgi:peptidoglycan/xylan/chitin deacetylase (PgdA/CDA1 family)